MSRLARWPPRYWLVVLAVILLFGLPTQITSFQSLEWAEVLMFAIVIMGLNLLVGYSGPAPLAALSRAGNVRAGGDHAEPDQATCWPHPGHRRDRIPAPAAARLGELRLPERDGRTADDR